jgi:hypothetical protein
LQLVPSVIALMAVRLVASNRKVLMGFRGGSSEPEFSDNQKGFVGPSIRIRLPSCTALLDLATLARQVESG